MHPQAGRSIKTDASRHCEDPRQQVAGALPLRLSLGSTRSHPGGLRRPAAQGSYVRAQYWTTCRFHSAGLAAAVCKRSMEPAIATASAKKSAAHVVRGLPRFRRLGRLTLCCRASFMGVPMGAAAQRPANTSCCIHARGQFHVAISPGEHIGIGDAADEGGRCVACSAQAFRVKAVQTASRGDG